MRHTANFVAGLPARSEPIRATGAIKGQAEVRGVQGCPADTGDGALPPRDGLHPVLQPHLLLC